MKRRFLSFLMVGISFAPAVFANDINGKQTHDELVALAKPSVRKTGEVKNPKKYFGGEAVSCKYKVRPNFERTAPAATPANSKARSLAQSAS